MRSHACDRIGRRRRRRCGTRRRWRPGNITVSREKSCSTRRTRGRPRSAHCCAGGRVSGVPDRCRANETPAARRAAAPPSRRITRFTSTSPLDASRCSTAPATDPDQRRSSCWARGWRRRLREETGTSTSRTAYSSIRLAGLCGRLRTPCRVVPAERGNCTGRTSTRRGSLRRLPSRSGKRSFPPLSSARCRRRACSTSLSTLAAASVCTRAARGRRRRSLRPIPWSTGSAGWWPLSLCARSARRSS
jgi:hypothetical protein